MALTKEGTAYGPLRWKVGDDVECWWRNSDAPGCWLRGTVLSHWWRSEQWPKGQYAPYQVRLSNGTLIFAPRDDDSCIRESAPDLDLDPGRPWCRGPWLRPSTLACAFTVALPQALTQAFTSSTPLDLSGAMPPRAPHYRPSPLERDAAGRGDCPAAGAFAGAPHDACTCHGLVVDP